MPKTQTSTRKSPKSARSKVRGVRTKASRKRSGKPKSNYREKMLKLLDDRESSKNVVKAYRRKKRFKRI
jgi:hypothetical protein